MQGDKEACHHLPLVQEREMDVIYCVGPLRRCGAVGLGVGCDIVRW